MEMERLSYTDAIKHLAQRAGMELPGEVDDDKLRAERALRERLYAACGDAARFFHEKLLSDEGTAARAYLKGRGLDGKTVKRFGLGWAPEGWDGLTAHLLEKGYSRDDLVKAGLALVSKKEQERIYDVFRGRVIFPIIATNDRVVGFGARTLGSDTPKYINTGDTPIYNKRANLYALNMLKRKKLADIVMVEGYMDVISLHKAGVENAVASLGTALTQLQARLLKRYVERVYICYDGDAAGQNATLRGLDILAKEGLNVSVMKIPDGMDPDDYARRNGKDAFETLKGEAFSLNGFRLEHLLGSFDMDTPDGREDYAKRACAMVAAMEPVERERYIPFISRKTGFSQEAVREQCGMSEGIPENSIGNNRNNRTRKTVKNGATADKTEQTLLRCMLLSREAASAAAAGMAEGNLSFESAVVSEFAENLLVLYATGDKLDVDLLLARQADDMAETVAALFAANDELGDPVKAALDCVAAMKKRDLTARIEALSASARDARASGFKEALEEIARLQRELLSLK
jgi:DNA primase